MSDFPNTLDSWPPIGPFDTMQAVSHRGRHNEMQEAMEAVQRTLRSLSRVLPLPFVRFAGQFYEQVPLSNTNATASFVANQLTLSPLLLLQDVAIDQIGVAVATASAGNGRVLIYSADANGWPDQRLYESGNLDLGTLGYRFDTPSFTFQAGHIYWVGYYGSSSPTLRTVPSAAFPNLGLVSNNSTAPYNLIRRSVTFGSAPATWTMVAGDRASSNPPAIRFRVA